MPCSLQQRLNLFQSLNDLRPSALWIAAGNGSGRAVPRAAETAHAAADIQEEGLALLLAVVANIDAGVTLAPHDFLHRGVAGLGEGGTDRFAAAFADIQVDQVRRTRQAAGVGGQDSIATALHAAFLRVFRKGAASDVGVNPQRCRPGCRPPGGSDLPGRRTDQ
jgi:hypothetical protein